MNDPAEILDMIATEAVEAAHKAKEALPSSAMVLRRIITTAIRDAGVWECNADDRHRRAEPGSRQEGYEAGYATAMCKMKCYMKRELERQTQNADGDARRETHPNQLGG